MHNWGDWFIWFFYLFYAGWSARFIPRSRGLVLTRIAIVLGIIALPIAAIAGLVSRSTAPAYFTFPLIYASWLLWIAASVRGERLPKSTLVSSMKLD